jgi:hypothetical protein
MVQIRAAGELGGKFDTWTGVAGEPGWPSRVCEEHPDRATDIRTTTDASDEDDRESIVAV